MNWLERLFRRRALQRDDIQEAALPTSLVAMRPGTTFSAHGYNWRVMHRRCGKGGANPAIVCAPIGPTRRKLKVRRNWLRRVMRGQVYVD